MGNQANQLQQQAAQATENRILERQERLATESSISAVRNRVQQREAYITRTFGGPRGLPIGGGGGGGPSPPPAAAPPSTGIPLIDQLFAKLGIVRRPAPSLQPLLTPLQQRQSQINNPGGFAGLDLGSLRAMSSTNRLAALFGGVRR